MVLGIKLKYVKIWKIPVFASLDKIVVLHIHKKNLELKILKSNLIKIKFYVEIFLKLDFVSIL